jgi:ferric-dicitrate binding protein FerR (iron transport regulator)
LVEQWAAMAHTHQFPHTDYVERRASEWIARLNADDVSEDDRVRFDAWLQAHPLHARVYNDMCYTWQRLTAIGPLVRAVALSEPAMNRAHQHGARSLRWFLRLLRRRT